MDVLVCGASVAGPTLAYWLRRYGFRVTIVERAPALRKAGGHAVDLFAPALDIIERMGLLDPVTEHRTGTDRITVRREGARRPVTIDLGRLMGAVSRRHVEIMRDDLGEILHAATRNDVEYLFGDSVAAVSDDAEVTFERGLRDSMECVVDVDRLAGMYSARHMSDARAPFPPEEFPAALEAWPGLAEDLGTTDQTEYNRQLERHLAELAPSSSGPTLIVPAQPAGWPARPPTPPTPQ